jgi:hypothetical protein
LQHLKTKEKLLGMVLILKLVGKTTITKIVCDEPLKITTDQ